MFTVLIVRCFPYQNKPHKGSSDCYYRGWWQWGVGTEHHFVLNSGFEATINSSTDSNHKRNSQANQYVPTCSITLYFLSPSFLIKGKQLPLLTTSKWFLKWFLSFLVLFLLTFHSSLQNIKPVYFKKSTLKLAKNEVVQKQNVCVQRYHLKVFRLKCKDLIILLFWV